MVNSNAIWCRMISYNFQFLANCLAMQEGWHILVSAWTPTTCDQRNTNIILLIILLIILCTDLLSGYLSSVDGPMAMNLYIYSYIYCVVETNWDLAASCRVFKLVAMCQTIVYETIMRSWRRCCLRVEYLQLKIHRIHDKIYSYYTYCLMNKS